MSKSSGRGEWPKPGCDGAMISARRRQQIEEARLRGRSAASRAAPGPAPASAPQHLQSTPRTSSTPLVHLCGHGPPLRRQTDHTFFASGKRIMIYFRASRCAAADDAPAITNGGGATLASQIHATLRRDILRGVFPPGGEAAHRGAVRALRHRRHAAARSAEPAVRRGPRRAHRPARLPGRPGQPRRSGGADQDPVLDRRPGAARIDPQRRRGLGGVDRPGRAPSVPRAA